MRAVNAIDRAAERGSRLVRQILSFSRHQPLKTGVVDLRLRSDELSEMLERAVRGDVRLMVSLAEDLWPIECDVAELEIALMNLCVNARDAMPMGGLVRVEGRNCTLHAGSGQVPGLAGGLCRAQRRRYRYRRRPRERQQGVRAVLYDQGGRQGHRARPQPGLRLCAANGRHGHPREQAGRKHVGDALPAARGEWAGRASRVGARSANMGHRRRSGGRG